MEDSTIASAQNRAASIRDLLERDPVCLDIVQYLTVHSEAADTARGIAEWWIKRDLPATQDALSKLIECGVIRSHPVQDNTFVYAYTKNRTLRQTLARHVRALTVPFGARRA